MTKSVLVTGGCGFIGTHLVRQLVKSGYSVTVFDNLSNGRVKRIAQEIELGARVVVGDVANRSQVREVMTQVQPWGVVHLAGPVSVIESVNDPDKYYRGHVEGTYNVVAESGRSGARRLVFANSASVYGLASLCPTPESQPVAPTNPYSVCKYLAEQMALHLCRTNGIGCISLRLNNVYGEFASALFGLFVRQMRTGQPLTVTGDGSQRRDFVYVGDVAKVFQMALASHLENEVLNVGTGETISVLEMAEYFDAPINFVMRPSHEPDIIQGSIDRLRTSLPSAVPKSKPRDQVPKIVKQLCSQPKDSED